MQAHGRIVNLGYVILWLSLALWLGSTVFFSFVVAPRVFGFLSERLPAAPPPETYGLTSEVGRRLAGDTVGAIFPSYFAIQVTAGLLALASGFYLARVSGTRNMVCNGLAALALIVVTVHALTAYPRSNRVLDSHYQAQERGDEATSAELRKQFGIWHGISQLLNLLVIVLVFFAVVVRAFQFTPTAFRQF
jgi:hypothetical protein